MNTIIKPFFALMALTVALLFAGCKQQSPFANDYHPKPASMDSSQTGSSSQVPVDTTGALKDSTDIPIGLGVNSDSLLNSSKYASIVKTNFDNITPQYEMKQAVIVQSNGSFDYSRPDQIVQAAQNMGLNIHGHTLIWYQNNNGDYLRSLISSSSSSSTNLVKNGGFESFTGSSPDNWTVLNHNNGSFSKATSSSNVHSGNSALKVSIDSSAANYNTQIQSNTFATTSGDTYQVTFWIKASVSGCNYQVEGRSASTNYSGNKSTPTSYTKETYSFKADSSHSSITFDMGHSPASTSYIDDVTIVDTSGGGSSSNTAAQDSTAVTDFMKKYITQTVSHYQGEVTGWDVVNEPLNSNGGIRTNPDPSTPTTGGTFYWDQYVGDQYIPMAFKDAHQADPNSKLWINEYNLASNSTKLNALVSLVNRMKSNNIPIDGIGTEMHISINTSHSGIDNMFQKLAGTGLLIRISELDIRINPNNNSNFTLSNSVLIQQQRMYNYVVYSYMQNVPKSQRADITVWNLTDNGSWIVVDQKHNDYPTIFNKNYQKKPAYSGMMEGLLDRKPTY